MKMLTFSRTIVVGAEFPEEGLVRFYGLLEDHAYAMEVTMDVRASDGLIVDIRGRMKRFTTPVCPKAEEVLKAAVGTSVREPGWESKINREVGKKGCQHLAEIILECGRCLDSALMTEVAIRELGQVSAGHLKGCVQGFLESHPQIQGTCLARSKRAAG